MVRLWKAKLWVCFAVVVLGCQGFVVETDLTGLGNFWKYKTNNIQEVSAGLTVKAVAAGYDSYVLVTTDGLLYTNYDEEAETADYGDPFAKGTVNHSYGADTGAINAVTFCNDIFVAVGDIGGNGSQYVIHRSTGKGLSWTGYTSPGTNENLNSVTCGGSKFVAVGENGKIVTSQDGQVWTDVSNDGGYTGDFLSVTYGSNLFVAVGTGGEIQYSENGGTWTAATAAGGYVDDFKSIAAGTSEIDDKNYFVAVGASNEIQHSEDGDTWTAVAGAGANDYECVTYANGLFMAVTDGTTGQVELTLDPTGTWAAHTHNSGTTFQSCGSFELGGESQKYFMGPTAGAFVSWSDCACFWEDFNNIGMSRDNLVSVAIGNDIGVVIGNNNVTTITGRDGDFKSTTQDTGGSGAILNSVIYTGSQFVAVGVSQQVETSADGENWNEQNSGGVGDFVDVAYSGSIYVTVGATASIWTSSDLSTWTSRTAGGGSTENLQAVTYGEGLFVAVGANGEIQSSSDGITWTQQSAAGGYTGQFNGVTYGEERYFAVGTSGEIQISLDGVTWTQVDASEGYSDDFNSINYYSGLFVAVGNSGEIQTTILQKDRFFSRNEAYGYELDFYGVAVFNHWALAVGERGVIQLSRPVEELIGSD